MSAGLTPRQLQLRPDAGERAYGQMTLPCSVTGEVLPDGPDIGSDPPNCSIGEGAGVGVGVGVGAGVGVGGDGPIAPNGSSVLRDTPAPPSAALNLVQAFAPASPVTLA